MSLYVAAEHYFDFLVNASLGAEVRNVDDYIDELYEEWERLNPVKGKQQLCWSGFGSAHMRFVWNLSFDYV